MRNFVLIAVLCLSSFVVRADVPVVRGVRPSNVSVSPRSAETQRTLCRLTDVTLPRLDPNWTDEEAGSGPPPNLVEFACAGDPTCGGPIQPWETADVPEFAIVSPASKSPDGTPMHGRIPVAFLVTEGGRVYFFNTRQGEDLHFDALTVEARLK